jgi:acetyl coenzyme A synthetase (ADP forming)-like protein
MLEKLFRPSSVAVVGASRNRDKVGNIVLRNVLSTFRGKVFAVNEKADSVEGVKSSRSLKDVRSVDLVIVAVPRTAVPEVMEEAVQVGAGAAVVITSGFRETDEEGAKLENELVSIARKGGVRVLGPNTLGLVTPAMNATFAFADVLRGNVAVVAQSGGIGVYMLNWAQRTRTGLSYFVSLGNQADVSETDVFQFLADDLETRAIFSYLEGVADGGKFLDIVPDVAKRKPLVFLKGGIGKGGAEAAKTHTGSVAGSGELFRAAVRTVGGIQVDGLEDMLNLAKVLTADEPIRPDVLVVTNSGGHGVLTADAIESSALKMVTLTAGANEELKKVLPPQSLPKNPLDLSGDADSERYRRALQTVQDLDCTKLVIVQSLPMVSCSEVARVVLEFKGKGMVTVVMGLDEDAASRTLELARMPAFRFPEDAVKAINYVLKRRPPQRKIRVPQPLEEVRTLVEGRKYIPDYMAMKLMELYGVRTPRWAVVEDPSKLKEAAEKVGFPLVVKASTDEPIHKTEVGGVIMNVERDSLEQTYKRVSTKFKRVLLQQQLHGVEVFVGGLRDPTFGHAVVVGIGGVHVEVIRSLSYALSPVSEDEALEVMTESKVTQLLTARNRNYDLGSVARTISTISRMIVDLNVRELDVNPLMVNEEGAYAVDVRIEI